MMENTNNSRWWETYFVRYITGSVVGAVIVYVLLKEIGIDLIPCVDEIQTANMFVLGALGFAYCYLASAPITLLHAFRGVYQLKKNTHTEHKCWKGRVVGVIKSLVTNWRYVFGLIATFVIFGVLGAATYPDLWLISSCIGMVLFSIYAIPLDLYFRFDSSAEWSEWYFSLAEKRAGRQRARQEIIESYRHLREHGNAFFIVILELLLGFVLFLIATWVSKGSGIESKVALIGLMIFVLIYWLLPGAICWFVANKLERQMMHSKYLE